MRLLPGPCFASSCSSLCLLITDVNLDSFRLKKSSRLAPGPSRSNQGPCATDRPGDPAHPTRSKGRVCPDGALSLHCHREPPAPLDAISRLTGSALRSLGGRRAGFRFGRGPHVGDRGIHSGASCLAPTRQRLVRLQRVFPTPSRDPAECRAKLRARRGPREAAARGVRGHSSRGALPRGEGRVSRTVRAAADRERGRSS